MKNLNHENLLTVLAGTTLAICIVSTALLALPGAVSERRPPHEKLAGAASLVPDTGTVMTCDITAYCPESCCNTAVISGNGVTRIVDWSGRVASGDFTIQVLTAKGIDVAAVDPAVIPYGSIIEYGGRNYIALDTGSAIRGNRIDILLPDHESTVDFGVRRGQTVTVRASKDSRKSLEAIHRFVEGL